VTGATAGRHVLVMAKSPIAGRVKTRLCPPLSMVQAADVAEAALADTLEAVASCAADRRVVALDGPVGPWLPEGFELIAQRGSAFDERLANAWADTGGSGIQIGMDTPQVTAGLIDTVLALLDEGTGHASAPGRAGAASRTGLAAGRAGLAGGGAAGGGLAAVLGHAGGGLAAVLGHAADGGWWVIGLPLDIDPHRVFCGVPMSESFTGAAQERRLGSLGLEVRRAPLLRDIDTVEDLAWVTADAPATRTAAVARHLSLTTGRAPAEMAANARADMVHGDLVRRSRVEMAHQDVAR